MTKTMSEVSCKGSTPSSMGWARRVCSSSGDSSSSGGATDGVAMALGALQLRRTQTIIDMLVGEDESGT